MYVSLEDVIRTANSVLVADGKLEAVDEYFASDYVVNVTDRTMTIGREGVHHALASLRQAFPDISVEVEILVVEKNRIAWRRTCRGIQLGGFKSFPASNRRLIWCDMVTTRFRNGLIAEEWLVSDLAERLLLARKAGPDRPEAAPSQRPVDATVGGG